MAQKKLLCFLMVVIVSFSVEVLATPGVQVSTDDQVWAKDLAKNATGLAMNEIKQKYIELQRMLGGAGKEIELEGSQEYLPAPEPILRVFVSSSMNPGLLKRYALEAKTYGAVLVFKGLPDGSWRKLSQLVTEITGGSDEGAALQIDDEAFNHFGITMVPSFVLSREDERWMDENAKPEASDKVSGNIGIRGALRLIAAEGELVDIASQMLEQTGGDR
jgi:type-F conjugative transfer system pilin assembly protein TrbC